MTTRPNIVLIMTDQQRWDTLGAYGNRQIQTPNLDELARHGILFEKAFVSIPLCTPSRASFFTGQYPTRHGLRANEHFPLPRETPNLAQTLKNAGYHTILAGKDHLFGQELQSEWFDRHINYDHFGRIASSDSEEIDLKEQAVRESRRYLMSKKYSESDGHDAEDTPTTRITTAAIDAISSLESSNDPFFLWLSYPDPHPPFVVAEPYASLYRGKDIGAPASTQNELKSKPLRQQVCHHLMKMNEFQPGELERMREIYYGMVTFIDDQIGRFLRHLDEAGLAENTIVVFTSDHGDYLGDHNMIRKAPALYDCLIRIPLIMRWKGYLQPTRIDGTMVESVDIAGTLLELAGLQPLPHHEGKSLVPLLQGDTSFHKDRVFALFGVEGEPYSAEQVALVDFEAMFAKPYRAGNWLSPLVMRGRMVMVRTLDWKLIIYKGGEGELYNLRQDPHELENLFATKEYTTKREELMQSLIEWLLERQINKIPYEAPEPPFLSFNHE